MNDTVKILQRMTIKSFKKQLEEIDALAPSLLNLKDQPNCPPEIE